MYKRTAKISLILIGTFTSLMILVTCDLPTDPGPMPGSIIDTKFEPGLNVFGVIRADSVSGSSYIHVEKALTTQQMYEGADIFDTTAVVRITDIQSNTVYIFEMIADTTFRGYYFNDDFQPVSGHRYFLEIQSDILPTLTAETTVPQRPVITAESIQIGNESVKFQIDMNPHTMQYNCYLFSGDDYLEKQIPNNRSDVRAVSFDISGWPETPTSLVVIAYDEHLSEYQNSAPSFIPQTFHEMVNTVENGYGCFGSLAVTTIAF